MSMTSEEEVFELAQRSKMSSATARPALLWKRVSYGRGHWHCLRPCTGQRQEALRRSRGRSVEVSSGPVMPCPKSAWSH